MTESDSLTLGLRQMIAVPEEERPALASLDIDALVLAGTNKQALCDGLESADPARIDDECRGLLQAAKQANEVNRRVRNLVAANVAARLDALTGSAGLYRSPAGAAGAAASA